MDFNSIFRDLVARWPSLVFITIRVIFIAIVFEFLAWVVGRWIERMAAPFMPLDNGRDAAWRTAPHHSAPRS